MVASSRCGSAANSSAVNATDLAGALIFNTVSAADNAAVAAKKSTTRSQKLMAVMKNARYLLSNITDRTQMNRFHSANEIFLHG